MGDANLSRASGGGDNNNTAPPQAIRQSERRCRDRCFRRFRGFAFPLFVTGGSTLTREEAAIAATVHREDGLDLLEREHDVHRGLRTLRANAVAAGRISLGDRLVLDRAMVRLVDLIDRGEFHEPLAPQVDALRSAWDRVPENARSLAPIDAVMSADGNLVTAIRQHADLGVGSTALIESGVRLYDELLPLLGDRVDD